MMWNVNKAMIIGRDHVLFKTNKQDFCATLIDKQHVYGIICDGCGSGQFTEVGACLFGNLILNNLSLGALDDYYSPFKEDVDAFTANTSQQIISNVVKGIIEPTSYKFINDLLRGLRIDDIQDQIKFIDEYLLTTFIFGIVLSDYIIIGHCGDGVIIIDDNATIIHQDGGPHYLMYDNVPRQALVNQPTKLQGLQISMYDIKVVNKIAIGSDGLIPLVERQLTSELYGTKKRGLQRKFNVWSDRKIFYDDASCIVFEKVIENANSLPEQNN